MNKGKGLISYIVPLVLIILLEILCFFHNQVEWYSINIYPVIASLQRILTGWLPFSIGDILYLALAVWILIKVIKTIRDIIRKKITRKKTVQRFFRAGRFIMWVYIFFRVSWGLNYHRQGLDHQLQLPVGSYHSTELRQLLDEVIRNMNENRRQISQDTILPVYSFKKLRNDAADSYEKVTARFPFLKYDHVSVKKSIYSATAQYFGFTGYYNPFTGEAQLRTHLPEILKPFIICHEIGHQVGYAKENEASFAGYLAAASSADPYIRYSVYLDLYNSVRSKLLFISFSEGDTTIVHELADYNKKLDTLVRFDRRKILEYFRINQSPLSEQMSSVVMSMYEQYLLANKQSAGLKSYDDVVSLLIAFRRKYGRI